MMTLRRWSSSRGKDRQVAKSTRRFRGSRPLLESLEGRTLMAVFTVTNTDPNGVGSLPWAVSEANLTFGADVIDFDPGVTGTIKLAGSAMKITEDVQILGPGANLLTIDALGQSRVFHIDGATNVTIASLGISGGFSKDLGGGILSDNAQLTLENVSLTRNRVESPNGVARGGGVASIGGPDSILHVIDSMVTFNTAEGGKGDRASRGYGRDAKGGGIYIADLGQLHVINSHVSSNRAEGGNSIGQNPNERGGYASGGGVFLEPLTQATSTGSTYASNRALGGDGAMNLWGGRGGPAQGGAIYSAGTLDLFDDAFEDNLASGGRGFLFDFVGPHRGGLALGGAIRSGSSFMSESVSFVGNRAFGGDSQEGNGGDASGGALHVSTVLGSPAMIVSSTFLMNEAQGGKGGSQPGSQGGKARGGGMITESDTFVSNSTFTGNLVTGGHATAMNTTAGHGFGGGIYASGENLILTGNSVLRENVAQGGTAQVPNSVSGNGKGGGLYASGVVQLISDTTSYRDNQAIGGEGDHGGTAQGGGVFLTETSASFEASDLLRNEAIGGANGGTAYGGGVYSVTSHLAIAHGLIEGNVALGGHSQFGGGGTADGGALKVANNLSFHLDHVDLIENKALGGNNGAFGNGGLAIGGGLSISSTVALVTINEVLFEANEARGGNGGVAGGTGMAGALSIATSNLMLSHVDFESNHAFGGLGAVVGTGYGGAIAYFNLAWVAMFDTHFHSNQATTDGDDEHGPNLW
ncbi:hypothetical protein [Tautonia marina]|uniref:hypothetical protein n=1 Tax=Tautonia marina TaxID=2653855 RepID=UPI001260663E|nr:hypothetical protein [Tautonia marina]